MTNEVIKLKRDPETGNIERASLAVVERTYPDGKPGSFTITPMARIAVQQEIIDLAREQKEKSGGEIEDIVKRMSTDRRYRQLFLLYFARAERDADVVLA
jgi:hypothetical protein